MDQLAPGDLPLDITRFDIEEAAERIAPHVRRTPVMALEIDALGLPGSLVLKLELFQHTGSFKPRGAFNRMLTAEIDESGVLAASGGNFGLAVAYAAMRLGHRAEIFVPETSTPMKIEKIRGYGADVHVVPGFYSDAYEACEERALYTGAAFLHPYDQPAVVAGQGTLGRELDEQQPTLDTVIVAVGGSGLIGGIATWFADEVRVVGVEPANAPTLHAALEANEPVDVEVSGVAADALGARKVGRIGFAVARRFVQQVVLVSDEAIIEARRTLWDELRIAVEPGAAATLAAITSGAYVPSADERVALVLCGGNADPTDLA